MDGIPIRLCFVCLGNICRSPTAEGIMSALVADAGLSDRVEVHSAGTGDWHTGEPADPRAREEAERRGVELRCRASTFRAGDTAFYDLVLAMDRRNLADLHALTPEPELRERLRLFREFDPALTADDTYDAEVPDPWFRGDGGFVVVYDLVEAACRGLLVHVHDEMLGVEPRSAGDDRPVS